MAEDTPDVEEDEEPVESLEDSISKIIDGQGEPEEPVEDESEDEKPEEQPEETEEEPAEDSETAETDPDEPAEDIAAQGEETDGDDAGSVSDDGDDKLDPPEHWAQVDKERFENVPKTAQEFLLERHKAMEGDYTRKMQEIAPIRRQYEQIEEVLAPFESEFAQAGLDKAGAIRRLASVHAGMKTQPRETIQWLAQTYWVDLSQSTEEEVDPAYKTVLNEIGSIKQALTRQEQEAQQQKQSEILNQIQEFKGATDGKGNLLHPHFESLEDDMAKLFSGGFVERGNLKEAYETAVRMKGLASPEPAPVQPKIKPDQAEKVKNAKRAAAGVKSSGAVGKKARPPASSWEEEVASHF